MPLSPGTRLGPYDIVAPLGAGGMGEVYRARDTRLDRTIAIKILPVQVSNDPVRKQRFEREAKTISSLNHPHICVLHDIGSQDGVDYLVMECVEGETLAKRLEKGAQPVAQVLKYGAQIADALDKAHRAGIVHRDLKPGNIMLTATGVKLLDFGLAKAAAPLASLATLSGTKAESPVTEQGTIVGTFQYMSPEQIEGKELDGRSDIFSLGAVLYEMVTGQRAFPGKSQLTVASAILEKDPAPIGSIKPLTPPSLDHAIRRCLAKDPEERWQTARDLALELKWIAEGSSQADSAAAGVPLRKLRERMAWVAAAIFVMTAVVAVIGFVLRAPKPQQPVRLSAETGADAPLAWPLYGSEAVLSPDGMRIVFVVRGADNVNRLYIRSMDQIQAAELSGTEGARSPFFSPDGQWVGFFTQFELKKVPAQGGATVTLCKTFSDLGGSWGEDGTIVFAQGAIQTLFKVSEAGGTPQPVVSGRSAPGVRHLFPQILPGAKSVLYTSGAASSRFENAAEHAEIVASSLASGESKTVLRGGFYARYLPSGHLVYAREGTLFAVPFDLKRLEVTGQAVPIVQGVVTSPFGSAQFSVSETGTLVFSPGNRLDQNLSLQWMDQQGKATSLHDFPGIPHDPRFSPDGKRLALDVEDEKRQDILVYDLERDTLTRLTFSGEGNSHPTWSPDGQRITYASQDKGEFGLYSIRADGGGDAQRLTQNKNPQYPWSWRPDGRVLAFVQENSETGNDIMTVTLEDSDKAGWKAGQPKSFLNTPANEDAPQFSPDGHWLAYQSNESGAMEVYVRPFPGPGGKWQVSTGGNSPRWARNGRELLYRSLSGNPGVMAVTYQASGDTFHADKPRMWEPSPIGGPPANWDIHPDSKRIAALRLPLNAPRSLPLDRVTFVFNFFDELRREVPSGKN